MRRTILTTVGYNPYRKFKARPGDYAMVVVAVAVALALVGWALLG
jgi:hypothetical protein